MSFALFKIHGWSLGAAVKIVKRISFKYQSVWALKVVVGFCFGPKIWAQDGPGMGPKEKTKGLEESSSPVFIDGGRYWD